MLDLHGKRYHRTWARLARRVEPGDQVLLLLQANPNPTLTLTLTFTLAFHPKPGGQVLLLQSAVNWEAGQKLVLVRSQGHTHRALPHTPRTFPQCHC